MLGFDFCEARLDQEVLVLRICEERCAEQRHDYAVNETQRPTAVSFGDQGKSAARLQDSQNLSHVGWQVGPVVVRLHGRNNVEGAIGKRQCGNRTLPDLDSAGLNLVRVRLS